jgi:uncharacterized protein YhfF
MMVELAPIDPVLVDAFWDRAAAVVAAGTARPSSVEQFSDSRELADELIALVLDGTKRATAAAVVEFERAGEPIPEPGGLWIACDGSGVPRALLRTTEIRVGPLSSVDEAFAWDEGEGDRTRHWWLDAHERYFRRHLPTIGETFGADLPTVFERFEVLFA